MSNDLQNAQTSMTVEEVRGSLDSTDNGAVKNSIRNCLTVFQNDPKLEGAIRYNILTERIDIVKPLWWSKPTTTLNDTDLSYLMLYLEDQYTLTSEKKIQKAISIVADCNKYHPIRDYLNGLEWDGTERIRCALPHFLGAEESEFTYECLRLFMLGAISRVFKPGSKFETMLCLVGGQGAGKSTFFRLLAVRDEWFSDDLKRIDDDNVYRKMQGHWIIEMSEMIATANAKSIEEIKSFLSRQKEVYKSRMKPTRQTGCGNVCSAVRQTQWTFCPSTVPATGAFCRYRSVRSRRRFIFWRTNPHPGHTCRRCGRKQ